MTFDSAWNTFWVIIMRLVALALGGYLAWCELSGTYDYFMADQGVFNYIVKMMLGVTLFTAVAPAFMSAAWAAAASARCFSSCSPYRWRSPSCLAPPSRARAALLTIAKPNDLKTEAEATEALANAIAESKKECNTGSGTSRGKKCDGAEDKRDEAAKRVDAARATINGINNPKHDPWFSRAPALTRGMVTEEGMRTYWPLLYPLVVSLAAGILLAFGVHSGRRRAPTPAPQPTPVRVSQRARPWWRRREEQSVAKVATSAPRDAVEVIEPEIVEPKRSPFRRQPDLRLVASKRMLGRARAEGRPRVPHGRAARELCAGLMKGRLLMSDDWNWGAPR